MERIDGEESSVGAAGVRQEQGGSGIPVDEGRCANMRGKRSTVFVCVR